MSDQTAEIFGNSCSTFDGGKKDQRFDFDSLLKLANYRSYWSLPFMFNLIIVLSIIPFYMSLLFTDGFATLYSHNTTLTVVGIVCSLSIPVSLLIVEIPNYILTSRKCMLDYEALNELSAILSLSNISLRYEENTREAMKTVALNAVNSCPIMSASLLNSVNDSRLLTDTTCDTKKSLRSSENCELRKFEHNFETVIERDELSTLFKQQAITVEAAIAEVTKQRRISFKMLAYFFFFCAVPINLMLIFGPAIMTVVGCDLMPSQSSVSSSFTR